MALTINHQTNDISATSGSVTLDGSAAGGGSWNLISTTQVSSAVASVAFTSIGSYNRYVLNFHCTLSSASQPKIQIYDNGSVVTSSNYSMDRHYPGGSLSANTTGFIGSGDLLSVIGTFQIDTSSPRGLIMMELNGFTSTGDSASIQYTAGGMKSTYSITDIDGFNFTTTTGTSIISSGTFSLYGISE